MSITINGSGTISGASTLSTTVASPAFTTPNIDSAQFASVSGTAPLYAARAWVNFNGTGTVAIRASGNVSSITDNGTGDYTINFTTAMPDANYMITCLNVQSSGNSPVTICKNYNRTDTTAVVNVVSTQGSARFDNDLLHIAIFR